MMARVHRLYSLHNQPYLCAYVDAQRDTTGALPHFDPHAYLSRVDRLLLLTEHYTHSLEDVVLGDVVHDSPTTDADRCASIAQQLFNGLHTLHTREQLVCGRITLRDVCALRDGTRRVESVKLTNYGLYYITKRGRYVDFTLGCVCVRSLFNKVYVQMSLLHGAGSSVSACRW
jgi:hypothetical protein